VGNDELLHVFSYQFATHNVTLCNWIWTAWPLCGRF